MQQPLTSRPGSLLLLLLPLLPVASGSGGSWRPFSLGRELEVSSRLAVEPARVALHYLNYRLGSPYGLQGLGRVRKATLKIIPGIGHKYYLQFTTEDYRNEQNAGACLATVLYPKKKLRAAVSINCTNSKSQKENQENDYSFYKKMRQKSKPITGRDLPDSYGQIEPSLEPVWALAAAGSSYIMWEKSTEDLSYFMAQVKQAKQWITKDDSVDFDYTVLLHEIPTQNIIICHMRVIWNLDQPLKVKYHCSSKSQTSESQSSSESHSESEEGSGMESGSTTGIFNEREANF